MTGLDSNVLRQADVNIPLAALCNRAIDKLPTWGSVASDYSDSELTDGYTTVIGRKEKRARNKSDVLESQVSKRSNIIGELEVSSAHVDERLGGEGFVSTGVGRTGRHTVTGNIKIVGKATNCRLRAAVRPTSNSAIAVYCISNLSKDFTSNDIRSFCRELGARTRYVHDITSEQSAENGSKAFKIAVAECQRNIIENSLVWPDRVLVRRWIVKSPVLSNSEVGEHPIVFRGTTASQNISSAASTDHYDTLLTTPSTAVELLQGAVAGTSRTLTTSASVCGVGDVGVGSSSYPPMTIENVDMSVATSEVPNNLKSPILGQPTLTESLYLADQLTKEVRDAGLKWNIARTENV